MPLKLNNNMTNFGDLDGCTEPSEKYFTVYEHFMVINEYQLTITLLPGVIGENIGYMPFNIPYPCFLQ